MWPGKQAWKPAGGLPGCPVPCSVSEGSKTVQGKVWPWDVASYRVLAFSLHMGDPSLGSMPGDLRRGAGAAGCALCEARPWPPIPLPHSRCGPEPRPSLFEDCSPEPCPARWAPSQGDRGF